LKIWAAFQDIRTPMITAAPAGECPDIFIGVHDWLGALVESGLVAPIDLGDKKDQFVPMSLDALHLYRWSALRVTIRHREPWVLL
jgi:maltose-binding protein MalE